MKEYSNTDLLGIRKTRLRHTQIQDDGILFHCHSHLQISMCISGTGTYMFEKQNFPVKPGDIMLLKKLEFHKCIPQEENTTLIFFDFSEDSVAPSNSNEFNLQYLQPFHYDLKKVSPFICCKETKAKVVGELLKYMCVLDKEKPLGYAHEFDACIKMIMANLLSYYLEKYPDENISKHSYSSEMQKALNYISANYKNNIKIEHIAQIINLSESRFRHIFKEAMRISVKSYIMHLRLAEAQKYLINTNFSIEEVAYKCGFGNTSHFFKLFKQYAELTPHEYRNISKLNRDKNL